MNTAKLLTAALLSTVIWCNATPERATLDRAALLLTTAEDDIIHEAYDTARTHLFAVSSLPLEDIQMLFRLGSDLIKIGEFQKSVVILKRILHRSPNNISVLYNIGYALKNDGHNDEALICYKKVLERNPNNDAANLALGYAYLNKGDFTNGWVQHERYLKQSGKYAPELRALLADNLINEHTLASKNTLAGKRILLMPEGGLGDTINFIHCAQLLRDRGAYVIALVQKPLFKLLQSCTCVDEIISGIPAGFKYDARVTYMSLPAALYLDETTMPKRTPYLFADPKLIDFWSEQLQKSTHDASLSTIARSSLDSAERYDKNCATNPSIHSPTPTASSNTQVHRKREYLIQKISENKNQRIESQDHIKNTLISRSLKIGICWQADLPHDESRLPVARRSIPLELLAQLADIPGVTLYSLQTHEHNAACHTDKLDGRIQTFEYAIDTEHGPFMDTAALIANMDSVITVDTATAHLAAALGKPTWLLLPYATDWRWIAHRTDSPWHPTMRIFKQPKPFDWQSVINEVAQALA